MPAGMFANRHEKAVSYQGRLVCLQIDMKRLFLRMTGCFLAIIHERAVSYKSWLFWFANYMEWLFCLPSQSLHVYFQGKQPGFVGNSLFMSIHIYMHAKQHAVVKDCHFM